MLKNEVKETIKIQYGIKMFLKIVSSTEAYKGHGLVFVRELDTGLLYCMWQGPTSLCEETWSSVAIIKSYIPSNMVQFRDVCMYVYAYV